MLFGRVVVVALIGIEWVNTGDIVSMANPYYIFCGVILMEVHLLIAHEEVLVLIEIIEVDILMDDIALLRAIGFGLVL